MDKMQIKRVRTSLGENQAQFGLRFGVSGIAISHWELGRSKPNAQRLQALMELDIAAEGPTPLQTPFRAIQYLGSKQRLARSIADVIGESVDEGARVGDLFAGTGVVSSVLAESRPVTAVDVQSYSSLIARAVLTCSAADFDGALSDSFWSEVTEKVSLLQKAAKALLAFEQEALTMAADGRPERLIEMIEHGSIAAHRQRPAHTSTEQLAKCLEKAAHALAASDFSPADITALTYFGGPYFSYSQAMELDAIGAVARARLKNPTGAEAALLSTASEVVNTVGKQFAQPIKLRKSDGSVQPLLLSRAIADRRRSVEATFRTWVSRWSTRCLASSYDHRVECADVLSFLERDESCGAYYADPPYTIDHYSRFYHVLETLVRRDAPALDEMNKLGRRTVMRGVYRAGRYQSSFCIPSEAPDAFANLFALASRRRVPLILSYSPFDEGSGARARVLTMEQLLQLGAKHYRTCFPIEISEHSHRKLNTRLSNMQTRLDAERLFLFQN
ncbi:DNA adenine methylase [Xylophilus sp. GOD-11R]|uniref:DNA adenine methylase n=1 Tax=Xylophilus sp. GOD-11R TaxID=3089814 RepID=UPI00298CC1E9|nr:DNA adenine methylase [Xylophilus sp. GOD-11R]WPB57363.1 DNA adenine methylase [Xylophilus sp. GOD-11R]